MPTAAIARKTPVGQAAPQKAESDPGQNVPAARSARLRPGQPARFRSPEAPPHAMQVAVFVAAWLLWRQRAHQLCPIDDRLLDSPIQRLGACGGEGPVLITIREVPPFSGVVDEPLRNQCFPQEPPIVRCRLSDFIEPRSAQLGRNNIPVAQFHTKIQRHAVLIDYFDVDCPASAVWRNNLAPLKRTQWRGELCCLGVTPGCTPGGVFPFHSLKLPIKEHLLNPGIPIALIQTKLQAMRKSLLGLPKPSHDAFSQ